jgi:hypothetical protein
MICRILHHPSNTPFSCSLECVPTCPLKDGSVYLLRSSSCPAPHRRTWYLHNT